MNDTVPRQKGSIILVQTRMSFSIATLYKNVSCYIWSFIATYDFYIWLAMAQPWQGISRECCIFPLYLELYATLKTIRWHGHYFMNAEFQRSPCH